MSGTVLLAPGPGASSAAPRRLAILGPGTLGLALAQRAAERGFDVRLTGRTREHADAGREAVLQRWEGSLRKGRLDADAVAACRDRLRAAESLEAALASTDAFVEALPESLAVKVEAWRELARHARPEVLWGTGSSSLPVSSIRSESGFPLPLLGLHFFIPLHLHRVMELITEPGTRIGPALELARALGLEVVSAPDQPGYMGSRLALIQGLEAMRLVAQGADPAEIDTLMAEGYGHPCGPLELSDRVGLDTRLAIASAIHQDTGNPAFLPPAILQEKVACGELGMKSGQGFYTWTAGRRRP